MDTNEQLPGIPVNSLARALGALLVALALLPQSARSIDLSDSQRHAVATPLLDGKTLTACMQVSKDRFACNVVGEVGRSFKLSLPPSPKSVSSWKMNVWTDDADIRTDGTSFTVLEYSGWGRLDPDTPFDRTIGPVYAELDSGESKIVYSILVEVPKAQLTKGAGPCNGNYCL